jgi:hypothetical protein
MRVAARPTAASKGFRIRGSGFSSTKSAGRWHYRPIVLMGAALVIAAMVVGCDLLGGSDTSGSAMDVRGQMIAFVQDFARQALAAWLF